MLECPPPTEDIVLLANDKQIVLSRNIRLADQASNLWHQDHTTDTVKPTLIALDKTVL